MFTIDYVRLIFLPLFLAGDYHDVYVFTLCVSLCSLLIGKIDVSCF